MAVNLSKVEKNCTVNLSKGSDDIEKVVVTLGWDAAKRKGKSGFLSALFGSDDESVHSIDCDVSVIMLRGGKFVRDDDLVYYGRKKHCTGSVVHDGDNLTGGIETLKIYPKEVPGMYDRLVVISNIYSGASKGQNFGKIENAYMKVDTGKEVFQYDLTGDYNGMLAIIFGELYREKGIWKFKAIGQGTTDKSIRDIVKRYR